MQDLFLIVLFALGANFLTVLQPIIFATMMELVIPKNLPILNTEKTNESLNLEQNNFFDLNFIGEKSLEIIQNFYDFSQGSTISSLIFLSSLMSIPSFFIPPAKCIIPIMWFGK